MPDEDNLVDFEAFENRRAERDRPFHYDFKLPATNDQGKSSTLATRAPIGFKHMVAAIIQQGKWPYETESEMIRHAVYEHMHKLIHLEPDGAGAHGRTHWAAIRALERTMNHEDQLREAVAQLDRLEERVRNCKSREEAAKLRSMYDTTYEDFMVVEDDFWANQALEKLEHIENLLTDREDRL